MPPCFSTRPTSTRSPRAVLEADEHHRSCERWAARAAEFSERTARLHDDVYVAASEAPVGSPTTP